MKLTLLLGTLAAAFALTAAPSPAWVPADADMVLVSRSLADAEALAGVSAVWQKTLGDMLTLTPSGCRPGTLPVSLDGLGLDESVRCDSAVASATLRNGTPSVILFAETDGLDAAKITAALKEADAQNDDVALALTEKDGWTLVAAADAPASPLLAYRTDGGLLMAATPDATAKADALRAGKSEALAEDSPLAKAFAAPETAEAIQATRFVLADLGALLRRSLSDEDIAGIAAVAPELPGISAVTFESVLRRDAAVSVRIGTVMADAEGAMALRDKLIGLRMMLAMALAQNLPPDSPVMPFLSSVRTEAEGKMATLAFSVTPETLRTLLLALGPRSDAKAPVDGTVLPPAAE